MLESIISSRTRIKLLMKFFINSTTTSYLRDLESEFGESSNAIRMELNRLEGAGLLNSSRKGNKKLFKANTKHPLFSDIHNILLKHTGLDHIVSKVICRLGGIRNAYLVGHFAHGQDNPVIDLLLVGENIDMEYLYHVIRKAEKFIQRRIRYMTVNPEETPRLLKSYPEALLLWREEDRR